MSIVDARLIKLSLCLNMCFQVLMIVIIFSDRITSHDSGHEDSMDDEDDANTTGSLPNVSLFSVAMTIIRKNVKYFNET